MVVCPLLGCSDDNASSAELLEGIDGAVPLRQVPEETRMLRERFGWDRLSQVTGGERVALRAVDGADDGASFVMVVERDGGFDTSDLAEFADFVEEIAAVERLLPVSDDAAASECCIARIVDGVAVLAGDESGDLVAAILAL